MGFKRPRKPQSGGYPPREARSWPTFDESDPLGRTSQVKGATPAMKPTPQPSLVLNLKWFLRVKNSGV